MKNNDRRILLVPSGFFILAFAINLFLLQAHSCIEIDGVTYVNLATHLFKNSGYKGFYPPMYPLLIQLINLVFHNAEFSARLVSVFFSSLTMFLLFFIARWAFGNKTAIFTCALALIYPNLMEYSSAALSESTFLFFFLLGIIVSRVALTNTRFTLYALSGFTWGIAYLTRPEGLGFILLMLLLLSYRFFREKKKTYFAYMGILLISFLIAAFPHFLNLKRETGHWTLGNQMILPLSVGEGAGTQQDWGEAYESGLFSLSEDGTKLKQEVLLGQEGGALSYILSHPKELFRRYIVNLHLINKYVLPGIFYPLILIFFTAGLLSNKIEETKRASVVFLSLIPFLLTPLFFVAPRYFLYFIPIILIWVARGVVETAQWIVALCENVSINFLQFCKRQGILEIALVVTVVFSFVPFTFRPLIQKNTSGNIYRIIGVWIKTNLPKDSKVMCRKPWVPFYADMKQVTIPFASWDRILGYARYKGAGYFLADQNVIGNREPLKFLFKDTCVSDDVKRVREFNNRPGNKIYLYKIMK